MNDISHNSFNPLDLFRSTPIEKVEKDIEKINKVLFKQRLELKLTELELQKFISLRTYLRQF